MKFMEYYPMAKTKQNKTPKTKNIQQMKARFVDVEFEHDYAKGYYGLT